MSFDSLVFLVPAQELGSEENAVTVGLAASIARLYFAPMSTQSAFQRGVHPLLQILLPGKEEAVLAIPTDESLRERIEALAAKSTESDLTEQERVEYAGYVQANKFVAILRREARAMQTDDAS